MRDHGRSSSSGVSVLVTWSEFNGEYALEQELLDMLMPLAIQDALPALIRFLRFGDAGSASRFHLLDENIQGLFRNNLGRWVGAQLSSRPERVFFTRWQLLAAIKLVCTFGATGDGVGQVRPLQLLDLLLMVNDFVHRDFGDSGPLETFEQQVVSVKGQALKGNMLLHHEPPLGLIGRYSDLLGSRAGIQNSNHFRSWLDIDLVASSTMGVGIADFRSLLFSVYASLPNTRELRMGETVQLFDFSEEQNEQELPFCFDPESWFVNTSLSREVLTRGLDLVTCSPEQIRGEHNAKYGQGVGRLFDLGLLLRKPIIKLADGCLAGLSTYLVVQRYTSGLYWDIHDSLPDDSSVIPNRRLFQTFFGELHEDYGRDVLRRMTQHQSKSGRRAYLYDEGDYSTGPGKNPDNVLVEIIGRKNIRCTFFEFKVGRPRYDASLVTGDLSAFQEDLEQKIGAGLGQEVELCRDLLNGTRGLDDFSAQDVKQWFFVIVVTDPFPALAMMLDSLQIQMSELPQSTGVKYHGPFVLSLLDLEQLETLMPHRVSELLIEWEAGPCKGLPFGSFYWARTKDAPKMNEHVKRLGDHALDFAAASLVENMEAKTT
ncbi:MAG: hypothetical protein BZY80_00195 [SAR202 cluster bacterium Io17-Chloro-G2]|nr:MAG: hypothetical protein BZY80_00195 [SAR202 cluster bacterium Io17-Chloro-G2]